MANKLVKGIINIFGGITSMAFGKEILVFIISLMPIVIMELQKKFNEIRFGKVVYNKT